MEHLFDVTVGDLGLVFEVSGECFGYRTDPAAVDLTKAIAGDGLLALTAVVPMLRVLGHDRLHKDQIFLDMGLHTGTFRQAASAAVGAAVKSNLDDLVDFPGSLSEPTQMAEERSALFGRQLCHTRWVLFFLTFAVNPVFEFFNLKS